METVKEKKGRKAVTRTVGLRARVTKEEYSRIQDRAILAGMSVSEYIRQTALGAPIYEVLSKEERQTLTGLSRNLNQLLAFAHKGYVHARQVEEVLAAVKQVLKK